MLLLSLRQTLLKLFAFLLRRCQLRLECLDALLLLPVPPRVLKLSLILLVLRWGRRADMQLAL
jgi:hypothetical protein